MTVVSHLPPDFADNQRHLLSDVLNEAITHWGQRRAAVATGFFARVATGSAALFDLQVHP